VGGFLTHRAPIDDVNDKPSSRAFPLWCQLALVMQCKRRYCSVHRREHSLNHHPVSGRHLGKFDDREKGMCVIGVTPTQVEYFDFGAPINVMPPPTCQTVDFSSMPGSLSWGTSGA